ncbi:MAG: hypothetical protein ABR886_09005 [Dehalococcoidales bacterium]|jgi:hypothetical protein
MDDIINQAYEIVQCKECPWYKACVVPMKFTSEDIRRQIEQTGPGTGAAQPIDPNMQNLLSSMAIAAQNSLLEGCPVFIQRLRASPQLAQQLKQLMLDWGSEEKPGQGQG